MSTNLGRQVDINLLDQQGRQGAPAPLADRILTLLTVAAIVLLIPVAWLLKETISNTAALSRRLAVAQETLRQLNVAPAEVVALKEELAAVQKRANALDADLLSISGRRISWSTALRAVWDRVGANVALQTVQTDGRKLTIRGDATGLDAISAYVDRLRSTGYFSDVIIELVTSQGTPLPLPTSAPPAVTSIVLPTQRASATPAVATATPVPVPPVVTQTPAGAPSPTPPPTWTPYPTHTPYPTYTALPTYTAIPPTSTLSPTKTRTPTPRVAVRISDIVFFPTTVAAGGVLRIEVTVTDSGDTPLVSQEAPPMGYTYAEGESSPPGQAGKWRIGADLSSFAVANAHRYRWGLGGSVAPGSSRRVIGYVRLTTPGTYTYCVGIVQEFVSWKASCEGARTITVVGGTPTLTATPVLTVTPTRTRTPTACADGYEADDGYQQARVIGANSSLPQQHSFHVAGDADWVKFAVIPNITYTLRTLDVQGGADTLLTLFGNQGGVLHQLAQNDEDPANTLTWPQKVGPSRIDYHFTTTETTQFGTTFYARVTSPNPGNYGCGKTYKLSLTSPTIYEPQGVHLASLVRPGGAAAPVEQGEQRAAAAPRVGFTIIVQIKGGGP